MQDISTYLKKDIVRYVKSEIEKGNSVETIRKALLEAGHHHNLVDAVIHSLKKNNWDAIKAMNEPLDSKLQKELYYDVLNSIIRYMEYNLSIGKPIHEIEKTLLRSGHSHEIITQAMEEVLERHSSAESPVHSSETLNNFIKIISVLAFVVLLGLLSSSTKSSIGTVFLGLLPTVFTLFIAVAFVERIKVKSFLTILPFAFVMIFVFVAAFGGFEVFQNMDIKSLAVINLLISLFYVGIIIAASPEKEVPQHKPMEKSKCNISRCL